ncbi:DUF5916 domain-containing protein [Gillisia hiemivivida]|uniref:Carbohydrate binding family 9 domain-containing protein n=1 Tax=Gillisia hiemivivida TaxID=291190 RepID=A0A5C6ZYL1_9FLAO|nr:DUF5916 domain-containing protein [Gillisia hiemivivida]TXD95180.1 carbohydrate binding family 9 domain-containing protein [Gillisia hiemivivida]
MFLRTIFILFVCLSFIKLQAQNSKQDKISKKSYNAQRIFNAPKIDGILDDSIWEELPEASNFVMVQPGDGTPIRETHKTFVKLAYDDEAIYVAATMLDNEPNRILRQFTQRDNVEQSDFFLIDINTYNDGENQTRFLITSAGAIADAKMSGNNEDYSYNVVWEGEISFNDKGWYAELKIPYAALRFPKKDEQLWSIQFLRNILHLNEVYTWNYIDKSIGKDTQYNGLLKGIKNIDPPVRLSFYPYASAEVDNFQNNTISNFSAGLDIKYGISDAFTLDATLIPDFGQTAFDAVELNLGPFEQAFGENRAFFTEGTELFTKGNLFYSRRIGDTPLGFNNAQAAILENEILVENPENTDLLNAIKISGRTENGLGVGFFNAITSETEAIIGDTLTGLNRTIITEPFANYNIIVLDQQYNQNSSITLINTNVTRNGHARDGNVTGFLFDINNKTNSFNYAGEAKMSNVNNPGQNITGFASEFSFDRTKGNFRYGIDHDFANETYDINDLGLNFRNNYNNFGTNISYEIFEPTKILNKFSIRLFGDHRRRYKPNIETESAIGTNFFAVTLSRFAFGSFIKLNTESKDFFEPRREGKFVNYPGYTVIDGFISSDYRQKFAYDVSMNYVSFFDSDRENFRINVSPRFRFSDQFSMIYNFRYSTSTNRNSFVTLEPRREIFGLRDVKSIENAIQASYNFSTKQALNLSFRNFWSVANFEDSKFSSLLDNGDLAPIEYQVTQNNNPNANFNIWNLDLSYSWQFAPGSEAILLYRNSIFNFDKQSDIEFTESSQNLFNQDLRQNLSLRLVYFIDYNNVKNIFKG